MSWIGVAEVIEAAAARVTLVAFHDAGPLMRRHGAGAGIGEQVDEHVVGGQEEQVVVSRAQQLLALLAGGPANRLDALDAERLDDGFDGHGGSRLSGDRRSGGSSVTGVTEVFVAPASRRQSRGRSALAGKTFAT